MKQNWSKHQKRLKKRNVHLEKELSHDNDENYWSNADKENVDDNDIVNNWNSSDVNEEDEGDEDGRNEVYEDCYVHIWIYVILHFYMHIVFKHNWYQIGNFNLLKPVI